MDPLRHLGTAQKFALARHLRRTAPPAERYAWSLLRNRRVLGLKFRRQAVLHRFIVDFYCATERLVLELQGDVQAGRDRPISDAARAGFLEAAGYRVVRMRNREVTRERLEERLRYALRKPLVVPPLPKGEGDRG